MKNLIKIADMFERQLAKKSSTHDASNLESLIKKLKMEKEELLQGLRDLSEPLHNTYGEPTSSASFKKDLINRLHALSKTLSQAEIELALAQSTKSDSKLENLEDLDLDLYEF